MTSHLPRSPKLNYPEFPDSCPGFHFAFVINICEVFIYCFDRHLKKLGHLTLRQPKRLAFQPNFQFGPAVFGLVNQDLTALRG